MRPPGPWPLRSFALLVRLLPPADREAYGEALLGGVVRGWEERRERGCLARWRYLARQTVDLAWNAAAARCPAHDDDARLRRGGGWVERLAYDVRIAVRSLARAPMLVVGAVVALGVGIGVNLALASLLHAVILRPLPFEEPDRLVTMGLPLGDIEAGVTWRDVGYLDETAGTLGRVAGIMRPGMDSRTVLVGTDGAEIVEGVRVTPNFFHVLGVEPLIGSGVSAEAPFAAVEPSVLLSHRAWTARFGADPELVGTTLHVQDVDHRVAGVLPPDFTFQLGATAPEMYLVRAPLAREREDGMAAVVQPVARAEPGVSVADVQAELERLAPEQRELRTVETRDLVPVAATLRDRLVGDLTRPLAALGGAAALVFLVACANLATFFLARHEQREGDRAVRLALGAGRAGLARMPLVEAVLLGLVGGAVGLLLARLTTGFVLRASPTDLPGFRGLEVGPALLAAALGLSVVAGLLCGGIPAWRAGRVAPAGSLRRTGVRGSSARTGASGVLTGVEAGALVVLLVAAGLSLRSLGSMLDADLGFRTEGRATALAVVPPDRATPAGFGPFVIELEETLRALPSVESAGTITHLPLDPEAWGGQLTVEGEPPPEEPVSTEWELASPGYFEAAGIPVLRGRTFTPEDRADGPMVTVVSRSLAERIRPDGRVVGMRISSMGPDGPFMDVVGVVADVQQRGFSRAPRPYIYVSHGQWYAYRERALVVEAAPGVEPLAALRDATDAALRLEPDLVVARPRPLEELVVRATGTARVVSRLLTVFGAAALLVALAGIYGVTAFSASRRRRELGIRACLGAARPELLARSLGAGLVPVGAGVLVGAVAVVVLAPLARGLVFGVSPLDPTTLIGVPLLLLAAAGLAGLGPALGAARTNPAAVIREE